MSTLTDTAKLIIKQILPQKTHEKVTNSETVDDRNNALKQGFWST